MTILRNTGLLFFVLLLAGCGFHLRGSQDLSAVLPEVALSGVTSQTELGRLLYPQLDAAKVKVTDDARLQLRIVQDSYGKRVLSLDNNGRANQYELSYQLGYELVKTLPQEDQQAAAQTVTVLPVSTIRERREYLFDANRVLAKAEEEQRLKQDMRKAAVEKLLRRLQFSLKTRTAQP